MALTPSPNYPTPIEFVDNDAAGHPLDAARLNPLSQAIATVDNAAYGRDVSQVLATIRTTAVAPTVGKMNLYDCTSGALAPVIPLANSVASGFTVGFKKTDVTTNVLTATCSGSDHIDASSGGTSLPLRLQNEIVWFTSDGVSVWTKTGGATSLSSLDARFAAASVATTASAAATAAATAQTTANSAGTAASAAQTTANAALPTAGGTMTGVIAMGSHKITGLTNGTNPQDAATIAQLPATSAWTPVAGPATSGYYVPLNQSTSIIPGGFLAGTAGRGVCVPFTVARTVTPTAFALEVTTLAAATFFRMGFFADNGGVPGTLISGGDLGQADVSTLGIKTLANTLTFTAGVVYWHLVVPQGTNAGTVGVRMNSSLIGVDVGRKAVNASTASTSYSAGFDVSGVTAAMPSTLTLNDGGGSTAPRVLMVLP